MHVIWFCSNQTCHHERSNGVRGCLAIASSNTLGIVRLFDRGHASRNWWHSVKLMPIIEIWWGCDHHNSTETCFYGRDKRYRNVSRSSGEDTWDRVKHVILRMHKMWTWWSNFWQRIHTNYDGSVWHKCTTINLIIEYYQDSIDQLNLQILRSRHSFSICSPTWTSINQTLSLVMF